MLHDHPMLYRNTFLFALLIASHITQAQITLESTATTMLRSINSLSAGTKLMNPFETGAISTIYNIDLTPFRALILPTPPSGYTWSSVDYITETLFDTDDSTIEFLLTGRHDSEQGITVIGREDGTTLFNITGSCLTFLGNGLSEGPGIFETDGGAKMLITSDVTNVTMVYSLPGHVPCVSSCQPAAMDFLALGSNELHPFLSGSSTFPNPANERISIEYSLPYGEVQARLVVYDATGRAALERGLTASGKYVLETAQLPNGMFHFVIIGREGILTGSKFVVMR